MNDILYSLFAIFVVLTLQIKLNDNHFPFTFLLILLAFVLPDDTFFRHVLEHLLCKKGLL